MKRLLLILLSLLLGACAGSGSPQAETDGRDSAGSEPAGTTATAANDETVAITDVTITGADGLDLVATFYPSPEAGPRPGIILLHMLNDRRTVWADFAGALNSAGYSALAVDMRGHGETGGSQDWSLAETDLQRVWDYLVNRPDIDPAHSAFVGGSIGANMALRVAANEPGVTAVVLLSAGLDYRGVTTEDALAAYGDRPIFFIASHDDAGATRAAETLFSQAGSASSQLHLYDNAGHGTNMFNSAPELSARIIGFLSAAYPPP